MNGSDPDRVPRHACGKFQGSGGCRCAICADVAAGFSHEEALRRARDWREDKLQRYGWYAEHVAGGAPDADTPTGTNSHTHGLAERYGQPDFQIVIPLAGEVAHGLFVNLVARVKAGERFAADQWVDEVAGNGYQVRLVAAREGGRDVLRVVIPDPDGCLTPGLLSGIYLVQYVGTAEEPERT